MQTPGDPLADLFASTDPLPSPAGPFGQLGDDLDILEIRRGGMGEVLICRRRGSDETPASAGGAIAYKTFQRRFFFKPQVRAAYLREVRLWSRLAGVPHIMPVLGFQNVEDRPFVLMPAVLGGVRSLRDVVGGETPDPWRAAFLAAQVALGMHLAGERVAGLVHGDLKPENVLFSDEVAYISDFGLARAAGEAHVITSTPAYRSPELRADPSAASVSSDVYAFGVLLWELLTGGLPREGDPLPEPDHGLAALAWDCLAADPRRRPASFGDVYLAILRTAGRHAPGLTAQIMDVTARVQLQLEVLAPLLTEARLESLTNLQEYDLAIEEADGLPEFLVTPAVLARRGHALSLAGRDEEAIAAFDRALDGDPGREVRLSCKNGKGLSLKRLGRYDEAIELLGRTVLDGFDDERAMVMMNLATVYLERGDHADALPLLLEACKLRPDVYQTWANLGQAYEGTGDYRAAEAVYRRAVRLAPHEMLPAMHLAAVCMDHLGQTAVAWAVLEQLGQQGHMSPEWAARVWACLLVGGKSAEEAHSFAVQARETWPESAADIAEEAHRLATAMAAPEEPVVAPRIAQPSSSEAEPSGRFSDLRDELPSGFELTLGEPGEPDPLSNPEVAAGYAVARDGELFLGVRVYLSGGFHCFDFFGAPEHPAYLDRLADSLAQARAVIETRGSICRRREIPPYYHQCPACGVLVLTDRVPGVPLRCRGCAVSAPTRPLRSPEFDGLVRKAADRLGHAIVDISGLEQLFLAELPDDRLAEPMAILAARLGFEPVDVNALAPRGLLAHVRSTRMPTFGDRALVAFHKTAGPGVLTYGGGGTPDLEELEFLLRATTGLAASAGAHYDPRGDTPMEMIFAGRDEDLLADLLVEVSSSPHAPALRQLLAWQYVRLGQLDEATEAARVCIERWPADAQSWLLWAEVRRATGDPAGAIDAVQRSLVIDPVQPSAFELLARCHEDLGDADAASAAAQQSLSLGGGA
ncbi:tetratricopeptide repeat protein [Actinomadura sp. 6N118]|uniref:tetratricopeptide repeat protein n=1 Tax=Actinomadura sp. 6N118 TaxID=3375151 RepID=UPI0037A71A36